MRKYLSSKQTHLPFQDPSKPAPKCYLWCLVVKEISHCKKVISYGNKSSHLLHHRKLAATTYQSQIQPPKQPTFWKVSFRKKLCTLVFASDTQFYFTVAEKTFGSRKCHENPKTCSHKAWHFLRQAKCRVSIL